MVSTPKRFEIGKKFVNRPTQLGVGPYEEPMFTPVRVARSSRVAKNRLHRVIARNGFLYFKKLKIA